VDRSTKGFNLKMDLAKSIQQARTLVKADVKRNTCLLLDVSYSMNDVCDFETGEKSIDALIEVAKSFKETRTFLFADRIKEAPVTILEYHKDVVGVSTNMKQAFEFIKQRGIKHTVLVTDGEPDDEEGALQAAKGLVLDIIYVGSGQIPEFLCNLARITGGQSSLLSFQDKKRLIHAISGLLEGPKKKAIEL